MSRENLMQHPPPIFSCPPATAATHTSVVIASPIRPEPILTLSPAATTMSDTEYNIESADAGASTTIPMEAGQIKKGG